MSSLDVKTENDDCLLQIYESEVWDGDLISKDARTKFVQMGWVRRAGGFNIITELGKQVVDVLGIRRVEVKNPFPDPKKQRHILEVDAALSEQQWSRLQEQCNEQFGKGEFILLEGGVRYRGLTNSNHNTASTDTDAIQAALLGGKV